MSDAFERAAYREQLERARGCTTGLSRGFRSHATVYAAVNAFLFLVWLVNGGIGTHPWFVYPLAGWGIGLAVHWTNYRALAVRKREIRRRLNDAVR